MICIDTDLPYHQQDTPELCGRAVAQMLLAAPKLGGNVFAQGDLVRRPDPILTIIAKLMSNVTGKAPWNTSPDDLCAILNNKAGAKGFTVHADVTREAGCQRIAHAVVSTGIAVPVVVFGADHWVAVSAVMLDGDANAAPPVSPYAIKGFFVNNPLPRAPAGRVHAQHDPCGQDGDVNGSANTYVTLQSWNEQYWDKPCEDLDGGPAFVTVSNASPLPPASLHVQPAVPDPSPFPLPLSRQDALNVAELGIRQHDLKNRGPLTGALASAQATGANGENDDDEDDDPTFFIVDLVDANDKNVGSALVDALGGAFQGVQAPPSLKVPLHERPSIIDRILGGSVDELDKFANVAEFTNALSRAKQVTIAKNLIWQPSVQSMSPFYGFIHADVGGNRWLIGVDGSVQRDFERIHA